MRVDTYAGVPRQWKDGAVWSGLVSCHGGNVGRVHVNAWEVREEGKVIYRATSGTGVSRKAIDLAKEVAARHGNYQIESPSTQIQD